MSVAKIVHRSEKSFKVEIEVSYKKSMLEGEEAIQEAINQAGCLMTGEMLCQFDTDGSPIMIGGVKWTSKGLISKTYQTPYGEAEIERHIYQSPKGGAGFCPLERDARIILTATPKFAKILASKYAEFGSSRVNDDLEGNHGRKVARSFIQNVCDAVGAVAIAKEGEWEYAVPETEKPIKTISVGLDGTCMLMMEEGYRQAMVGTIALFDKEGERQFTLYTAAAPEYGKKTFLQRLDNEVSKMKERYPNAHFVGLADGARDNWDFLETRTDTQIIDFYHVTEYLNKASEGMFPGKKNLIKKQEWLDNACHNLKHTPGTPLHLLNELKSFLETNTASADEREQLQKTITYLENNKHMMNYPEAVSQNLPIGSGVTEAACKVIVKQRLCSAGMKWKERGAAVVLSLRSLSYTTKRWYQFWKKIDRFGFPVAA